jgi:hypothetical protein
MENEKKLKTDVLEISEWESLVDYQQALYDAHEHEDPDALEFLFLHRPEKFLENKVRGEEELLDWLKEALDKKYGRKPMVELDEKTKIVVPINTEKEE